MFNLDPEYASEFKGGTKKYEVDKWFLNKD